MKERIRGRETDKRETGKVKELSYKFQKVT